MKLKYLFIAVVAGLALVGCNKEIGKENGMEGDRYMGFQISMASSTKATTDGGYEYGTDAENGIKSVYFFFYKDGAYLSYGKGEVAPSFVPEAGTTPSVEEIWRNADGKGVVVLESNLHTQPNQLICVINSQNPTFFRNKPLAEALNALQTGDTGVTGSTSAREIAFAKLDADGSPVFFSMMNSPEISGGVAKYALEFDSRYIKNSAAEAENNPVEVYVERMASKVSVDYASITVESSLAADYDISIDSWGLNGVSQNAYSIKKIDASWPSAAWNSPAWVVGDHRINWAIDPDYSGSDFAFDNLDYYPHCARDYGLDATSLVTTPRTTSARLKYWSMNEINAHAAATLPKYDKLRQMYALENTFDKGGQNDARYVGTHVLVLATVKKKGEAVQDLYLYMGKMRTLAEYQTSLIGRAETACKLYVEDGGSYRRIAGKDLKEVKAYKPDDFDTNGGFFALAQASSSDKAYTDGYITLYPTVKVYKEDTANPGDYIELTSAEMAEAFLENIADIANKYYKGAMWYCVPVEHLGSATDGTGKKLEGNYGMVRNHVYKITLDKVLTLGKGIDDPNEPIVPGEKAEKWYLAAKINVNAWHIVNQTSSLEE